MRAIRKAERAIEKEEHLVAILRHAKYVTIAMCEDDMPYLVTVSHGYDPEGRAIYFHCAFEGKKIDILRSNNVVWGQAMIDCGYVHGECTQHYATTMFKGRVTFVDDPEEKRHGVVTMIRQLEPEPDAVIERNTKEKKLASVNVGRIDLDYMSGKKTKGAEIPSMTATK
jgi:nitroimidazol reductase NimA-like FMN-containing flavoprotein (pyridoxamine 5'-phosphate oxidase superfamily)